jgi:hypothetical protein
MHSSFFKVSITIWSITWCEITVAKISSLLC